MLAPLAPTSYYNRILCMHWTLENCSCSPLFSVRPPCKKDKLNSEHKNSPKMKNENEIEYENNRGTGSATHTAYFTFSWVATREHFLLSCYDRTEIQSNTALIIRLPVAVFVA